jgi:hypothetical protein
MNNDEMTIDTQALDRESSSSIVLCKRHRKFVPGKLLNLSRATSVFRQKVLPNKWFQAACVATLIFIIYFVTSDKSDHFNCYVRLSDAFLHGRLYIIDAPPWLEVARIGAKGFVMEPPGPTIFVLPWVAIWGLNTNQVIISMIVGAAAIGLFWVAATQLGWSFRLRLAMTALVALGTNLWWAAITGSVWSYAHVSAVFFLMAALVETTGRNRPWLIGLLVGFAGLSRLLTFLTFPFFAYTITREHRRWKLVIRRLIPFFLAVGALGALYLLYCYGQFGTITSGYYHGEYLSYWVFNKGLFDISYIPRQLYAILFQGPVLTDQFPYFRPSWVGLGLFFTTPALLYMFRAHLKDKMALAAVGGLLLTSIPMLTCGATGLAQFGYRFSLDILPFMILLVASGMCYRLDKFKIAIIILSCCINLWGVITTPR